MSHTFSLKQIWKYWDFDSTLLVIKQIWAFCHLKIKLNLLVLLDVIYLTSTALGQRDFEGTGSKIWLVDVGYVVILKVK